MQVKKDGNSVYNEIGDLISQYISHFGTEIVYPTTIQIGDTLYGP